MSHRWERSESSGRRQRRGRWRISLSGVAEKILALLRWIDSQQPLDINRGSLHSRVKIAQFLSTRKFTSGFRFLIKKTIFFFFWNIRFQGEGKGHQSRGWYQLAEQGWSVVSGQFAGPSSEILAFVDHERHRAHSGQPWHYFWRKGSAGQTSRSRRRQSRGNRHTQRMGKHIGSFDTYSSVRALMKISTPKITFIIMIIIITINIIIIITIDIIIIIIIVVVVIPSALLKILTIIIETW